jgi:DNA-binding beta-propeller fold protein YncE
LVALDQEAGALFVTDRGSAAVSVLQTADCNSEVTKGCPALAAERPVGSKLVGLAVDQASSTVYVTNTVSGTMSVLNTN